MPDINEISTRVEEQSLSDANVRDYARIYPNVPDRLHDIVKWLDRNLRAAGLLFLVERIDSETSAQGAAWSEKFSLTPAEIRLCVHLLHGGTINGFANARDLSRNTVRNQLQSIYSKTGAHRQAELIRLLLNTRGGANTSA